MSYPRLQAWFTWNCAFSKLAYWEVLGFTRGFTLPKRIKLFEQTMLMSLDLCNQVLKDIRDEIRGIES